MQPGLRAGLPEQARDRALVDDLAALAAGPRAEVDDVVGGGDERRVVLDHDHGVAGVRQPAQDGGEAGRVARVQAHRRLVEHVERAGERAAERGREGDALRLAAREGPRLPAEGQVAEAHVHEEAQPAADLVQELLGGGVLAGDAPLAERSLRLGHRQGLDLRERAPGEPEEPSLRLEPRPAAVGARAVAAVAGEEDAHVHPVRARLEPLEEAVDAVPLLLPALAAARLALPDEALRLLRQVRVRHVGGQPRAPAEALEVVLAVAVEVRLEGLHAALVDRLAGVRDHQVAVDRHGAAEALAGLAGAHRVVEREEGRGRISVGEVAGRAVEGLAPPAGERLALDPDLDLPLPVAERRLERVHDPLPLPVLDRDAVEHDRDHAVLGVQARLLDPSRLAVLEHPTESRLLEGLADDAGPHLLPHPVREADEGAPALGGPDQGLEDGRRRVANDRLPALAAVEGRGAGVEGPQVVGDRGHRADRRSGGADGRGAVHRDRREDALDPLRPGPVEPLEELPGVGGEGLRVAPVALGVEHVEGERRLARPGHAGHRGDRADRHADAHALQVVLAGLLDLDEAAGHPPTIAGMRPPGKRGRRAGPRPSSRPRGRGGRRRP